MKRLLMILLLTTLLVFTAGCGKKNTDIKYLEIVTIPSLIETDIEAVPKNLNIYVPVLDEINVIKVTVDTSLVDFDNPGDYGIVITVNYSDGVSKDFNSVLRLSYRETIGIPVILGVKNRLISPTDDTIDFLDGVAFSDDVEIIDSGVIGSVNLNVEGIYTLIYYAEDNDGNYITTSSFIVVAKNLYFYDNFVNNLYPLSGQEIKWLREYSILYSAIHAANSDIQDNISYFGNFLTIEHFETLLNRPLRKDECDAIIEVQKIFRKNDVIEYETYYNVTLSNNEKEQFERVYEIYTAYAATKTISNVDGNLYIAHTDISSLYYADVSDLNEFDTASLDLYRGLTKLTLDSMYFSVINDTRYEFDVRILDVDYTNIYSNVINDISELGLFFDREVFVSNYTGDEKLFAEIYAEYYLYKTLYKMNTYLLEGGELTTNAAILESAYDLIWDIASSADDGIPLLEMNVLDITILESMLERNFTTSEKEQLSLFITAYDKFYTTPYSFLLDLFDGYLTTEEEEQIKYVYTNLLNKYPTINIFEDNYLDIVNKIERDLTQYEIECLELIRFYDTRPVFNDYYYYELSVSNPVFIYGYRYANVYRYINDYRIDKDSLHEYLVISKLPTNTNYEFSGFLEYIQIFDSYYQSFNFANYYHVSEMMKMLNEKNVEPYIFERLILSNNLSLVEDNYEIHFNKQERQIISNYIAWVSNEIKSEVQKEKQALDTRFNCDEDCVEAMNTIMEEAFPSVFVLQDGYTYFNEFTFERIIGKPMPEYVKDALDILSDREDLTEFNDVFYRQGLDPLTFSNKEDEYYEITYDLYKKDTLSRYEFLFENYEYEKLTEKEQEAFKHFYSMTIENSNAARRDMYLEEFRNAGINIHINSFLRIVDLANEHEITMNNYQGELTALLYVVTDEEDIAHIHNVQELHRYYKYKTRYFDDLFIPNYDMPTLEDAVFAIDFLNDNGLNNSQPQFYYTIKNNPEQFTSLSTLNEEDLAKVWAYIELLNHATYKRIIDNYNHDNDFSDDFITASFTVLKTVYDNGFDIYDGYANIISSELIELTSDEEFVLQFFTTDTAGLSLLRMQLLIGKNYLEYGDQQLTIHQMIECMEATALMDMKTLSDNFPPNYSETDKYNLMINYDQNLTYEDYINTVYLDSLYTLVDEISEFNERFLQGETTIAELETYLLKIRNQLNYEVEYDSVSITPHYDLGDISLQEIDGYFDAVIPFIIMNETCNTMKYYLLSSDYNMLQDMTLVYDLHSNLNSCYTSGLLYNSFILEILEFDNGPKSYIILSEDYFFYGQYIPPYILEERLNRNLTEEELAILDLKLDFIAESMLLGAITQNRLTLADQKMLLGLTAFCKELVINGHSIYDYAENDELKEQYRSLLSLEEQRMLDKINPYWWDFGYEEY